MLSRAEARRLHALARPRQRRGSGLFLVEGVRLVEELLDSPVIPRLAVVARSLEHSDRGAALAARLRERVRTESVSDRDLRAIADTEAPQGVVLAAEIPQRALGDLAIPARCVLVVLDAVQDPGNFGTIVRSADAFGATAVCVLPGSVDPWNPKAVRAAAGSSLRVPIVETAAPSLFAFLRSHRFRILGADTGGSDIGELAVPQRAALILGNEGSGLGEQVRTALDATVSVPIRGAAESLNVGVAAGILLYMLARGRET
jgi:TrmH family RNA methyltransferase